MTVSGQLHRPVGRISQSAYVPTPASFRRSPNSRAYNFAPPRPLLMRRAGMAYADVPNVQAQPKRTIPPATPMATFSLPPARWRRQ